jgi:hypothetical protein
MDVFTASPGTTLPAAGMLPKLNRGLRHGRGQRLICRQNSGRIPPQFYSSFSNASKVFMEINPIVMKIKELRERTEALRGYL